MTKEDFKKKLLEMAIQKELDIDGDILQGYFRRDPNLQGMLAFLLQQADRMSLSLVGVNLEDPSDRARATRLQGNIVGYKAAVDIMLNLAWRQRDA